MRSIRKPLFLFALLLLCAAILAGCGGAETSAPADGPDPAEDLSRVLERGVLVVGVTDYPPLDYLEDGSWTGFDAELAAMFAGWIGVREVSFVEIEWDRKVELLLSGEIDVIWNGMTKTPALEKEIDCSSPYLSNVEVIVLPKDQFERYDKAENSYHLLFAVEDGSYAQELAKELKLRTIAYDNMHAVFEAVAGRKCDAAIADRHFAERLTAPGAEFDSLRYGFPFGEEALCVGLRKGSSLTARVDDFLLVNFKNGEIPALADRYDLRDSLRR